MPKSLGDLRPVISTKQTIDEFTGEPFVFKAKDKQYELYCVGANGKDNGGAWDHIAFFRIVDKDDIAITWDGGHRQLIDKTRKALFKVDN